MKNKAKPLLNGPFRGVVYYTPFLSHIYILCSNVEFQFLVLVLRSTGEQIMENTQA